MNRRSASTKSWQSSKRWRSKSKRSGSSQTTGLQPRPTRLRRMLLPFGMKSQSLSSQVRVVIHHNHTKEPKILPPKSRNGLDFFLQSSSLISFSLCLSLPWTTFSPLIFFAFILLLVSHLLPTQNTRQFVVVWRNPKLHFVVVISICSSSELLNTICFIYRFTTAYRIYAEAVNKLYICKFGVLM